MLNCNPETVSTDYDTSDRLYFEPLTLEDALNVIEAEQASGELVGVIVGLGGQTPLKLAGQLPEGLVLGTSPESIDLAEDRERWNALCARLEIPQPAGGTATTLEQAQSIVAKIGYPVLMRPSYVLGGRAMEIVYDDESLVRPWTSWPASAASVARAGCRPSARCWSTGSSRTPPRSTSTPSATTRGEVMIGGVMEHVEEAGVHSGDSACTIPPYSLSDETIAVIEGHTRAIADALQVVGLINVQYAVKANQVFVIEANPRASRTVPFVAKATGVPLVKVAARVMVGATLAELREEGLLCAPAPGGLRGRQGGRAARSTGSRTPTRCSGPEMRSTGEVMGIDTTFGLAFAKSQLAAGDRLPDAAAACSCRSADRDKAVGIDAARRFVDAGFTIAATAGTADALDRPGSRWRHRVAKVGESTGTDAVELISSGKVDLVVNSPRGRGARADGAHIRAAASVQGIPCLTTAAAGLAAANGIVDRGRSRLRVRTLQEFHAGIDRDAPPLPLEPCAPSRRGPDHDDRFRRAAEPGDDRVRHRRARSRAGRRTSTSASLGAVVVKSLSAEAWAGNPPSVSTRRPPG